ncbi:hypothetical protein [Leclercia adecarboxylata]|uniref:hypothetical protein n=1 Tax=Leclercia adecarboxylata TaxID=83655 RepID=UPI0013DEE0E2|nr:hypothetical protein [Leclercia adecarboxylata]QIG29973.1 hypothetical protein FY044_17695 [Leclercia adecarboxylata]
MSGNTFDIDKFKEQIPYYLTVPQKEGLIKALEDFPVNTNYYLSSYPEDLRNSVLQGDIFNELTVYSIKGVRKAKGIILSNSCDVDVSNPRDTPMRAVFAPLVSLSKLVQLLHDKNLPQEAITSKVNAIKNQLVTNMVYLPEIDGIEESVVFLDDVYQLPTKELQKLLESNCKTLTLSQVGFYILLFKISIHFCRFHEEVQRYDH